MATERTEHRPLGNPGLFQPRLNRPHRARFGIRSVGDADLPPLPLLVRFAPSQRDPQTVPTEGEVRQVETDDLRAAKRSCEASSTMARSREPISPASVVSTIARMSAVSAGAFCTAAVPIVRLMPFGVFRTRGFVMQPSGYMTTWNLRF
jgi:hypothetical protein